MSGTAWEAINLADWKSLPVLTRCANEIDVTEGRAVFYVPVGDEYEKSEIFDLGLPRPAIIIETSTAVFLVQAERVNGKIAVGYRFVRGGNGICLLDELELLAEPDSRFE